MSRHAKFTRLAESIGVDAALTLAAFFRGQPTLYVPEFHRCGHLIECVVGQPAFLRLIAAYGGETICLPKVCTEAEQRAGAVYRALLKGQSTAEIAALLGISQRRCRQIEVAIGAGGPLTALAMNAARRAEI